MATIRTLFLAANPAGTPVLALDEEIRAIVNKIRLSDNRDLLDVVSAWAVRPDDLLQYLNQYRPQIVHFSGHGSPVGDIILVGDDGSEKPVSPQALKVLFTTLKDNIQIVVLNACYSRVQAEAICEVIDYVVGMDDAIGDTAATIFAASFYRALGFDRTVQEAFDQARAALLLEGIPEENVPELLVRTGVSPHVKLVLPQSAPNPVLPTPLDTEPTSTSRYCNINVECSNIVGISCDVVVLKYAQSFYGADWVVANRISAAPHTEISPRPGQYVLLPSNGKVAAKQALFVGVPSLSIFGYGEIREFARGAMQILSQSVPNAKHVAMTVHGPGFGLDETESFLALIGGLADAFRNGTIPPFLQKITIVEKDEGRANRLRQILEDHLPAMSFSGQDKGRSPALQARVNEAGRHSIAKPHIFVAMAFSEEMEDTYIFGIQGPVNAAGYLCERVDMITFTGDILARIKTRIETASLVIADLTGANPNVYLEVGYAWGKDRPTLLIAKKGDLLKFDVQSQRCLIYKNIADLAKRLEADLTVLTNLP
jgi:hypothetical protein